MRNIVVAVEIFHWGHRVNGSGCSFHLTSVCSSQASIAQPQVNNLHSLKSCLWFWTVSDVPVIWTSRWTESTCFLTRVIETLLSFTWAGKGQELKPKCVSSADSYPYVSSLVWAFFMCLTPLWIVISSKHPASRTLLYSGWEPVITAMVISRCVCVFSLLKDKEQLSRVCTSQRLVCTMTHPLNKHTPSGLLEPGGRTEEPVGSKLLSRSLSLTLSSQQSVLLILQTHTGCNRGGGAGLWTLSVQYSHEGF